MKNSLIMVVDFHLNLLRTQSALKAILKEGYSEGEEYEAFWVKGPKNLTRWDVWRPVIAMAMQLELKFDEMHLLYYREPMTRRDASISSYIGNVSRYQLVERNIALIEKDIQKKSPNTVIHKHNLHLNEKETSDLHAIYEKLI
ncbi:MAG: hypothetical protein IKU71_07255, partial [Kiritimatiellae bacterium]|nr:hypothetical protein [Kiritimatiellia bacterium]